ncbi:MAG TPA: hypothetical protein PK214_01605 [Ottowia sp.]|nr:MAG: hypothetical protein BGO36_01390 [Burkholderiales bacterium 68-10]HOM19623.1 hypothetical protein [Ottowia sp.]
MSARPGRGVDAVGVALAAGLLAALLGLSAWLWQGGQHPLLLAPAIGELADCLDMAPAQAPLEPACTGPRGSAAQRIEATLAGLGPRRSADGHFELGYTLVVPLLNLFQPRGEDWAVDAQAVQRIANTVQGVDRPVVLYLFSTHFSEQAPIEPVLARDAANLAHTPQGPLPVDQFMGWPLYPWGIARTDNAITQRREQAIGALAQGLCALPAAARQRIVGINLLGEVHHLYPDFEAGMGHDRPYVLTDYSEASRRGFQAFLRQRLGSVAALNAYLGSDFASFDAVEPPSRDIRRQRLEHFWQHIDDAAAGTLAISGWAHDAALPAGATPWVRVYLDGLPVARVPAHFVRQDVGQALPQLGTDRVGWRHDLRFADLAPGVHRLDIALEGQGGTLRQLGTRHIAVMDRAQSTPAPVPLRQALPPMTAPGAAVRSYIDAPADGRAVFYNPLVPLWHAFRGQQVVDYLSHFDRLLAGTCLADVPRRTQQIYPAEKAGWDGTRFASEASLKPFGQVRLGINLYGEAGYDPSFFDWLARSRQSGYSVTEFHPLRGMDGPELRRVLEQHRAHGAETFSFFLHPPPPGGTRSQPLANPFAFDPQNPRHGSDALYRAVRQVMQFPGADR